MQHMICMNIFKLQCLQEFIVHLLFFKISANNTELLNTNNDIICFIIMEFDKIYFNVTEHALRDRLRTVLHTSSS